MQTMRAKMKVVKVEDFETCDVLHLSAVGKSGNYPEDGSDENNTFASYTPSAELNMTVANPALKGKIKSGQVFYLDFTEADE